MNYFFVFQNKTFEEEKNGGYLWAPKGICSHWRNMKNIKKGDIVFHSYHKEIMAISITITDCYEAIKPTELQAEKLWDSDGWKADCQYYIIPNPIVTSDYIDTILRLQPNKYAPFNRIGRGNTGYLFNLNKETAIFLLKKIFLHNKTMEGIDALNNILK